MESGFKKREALLNAAVKEFGANGFQNASLNTILKEAKVSKGVFYHYYENKDALYLEITGQLLEKKKLFIMERLKPEDMQGDIFHILRKSMSLGFEFGNANPLFAKFSGMLMRERGTPIFEKVMTRYNVGNDVYVSSLIRQGIANGNIRKDVSFEFSLRMITYMLDHINEILDTQGVEDYQSKVDELFMFLESGLRGQ